MKEITNLTADANQRHIITFEQNEIIIVLRYATSQNSWFMSITYQNSTFYNFRMSLGAIMFRNLGLPFAFTVVDNSNLGLDPSNLYDFAVKTNRDDTTLPARCTLVLLETQDIQGIV